MCNQIKAHVCVKLRGWSRAHGLANKQPDMHSVTHWSQPQLPTHTHIKSFMSRRTSPHLLFPSWNFNTWHQPTDTSVLRITGIQKGTHSLSLFLGLFPPLKPQLIMVTSNHSQTREKKTWHRNLLYNTNLTPHHWTWSLCVFFNLYKSSDKLLFCFLLWRLLHNIWPNQTSSIAIKKYHKRLESAVNKKLHTNFNRKKYVIGFLFNYMY